jgi:hypothetical protein
VTLSRLNLELQPLTDIDLGWSSPSAEQVLGDVPDPHMPLIHADSATDVAVPVVPTIRIGR